MARSATATVTELVAVLLPELLSYVVEETLAEPEITVPPVAVPDTVTTNVNVALPALAKAEPSVQVTVPVAPTDGLVQVQPEPAVRDEKVVFVGTDCVQEGAAAEEGPLLVTTME